jgi:Tol biopolymer transport system component
MIAFTQREEGTRFFRLSIPDTNAAPLRDEDNVFRDAKLSPDGSTIAYVSRTGYVWLYSLQDGSKRLLTPEYRYVSTPIWSPDGRWIAFNYISRLSGIAIVAVEGGAARKILESERSYYYCYSFSPDGEKIALYSQYGGNYEITTVNVNTGELQQLTSPPYEKLYPAWSPDGATIAYVAYEDSCRATNSTIWLLPSAGGQPRELATFPGTTNQLLWSPDGASLLIFTTNSREGGLFQVSLADGSARLLSDLMENMLGWFPDGQTLLTIQTMVSFTIRAVSLEDKQTRLISDKKIDRAFYPVWLNDTEVAFIRNESSRNYAIWKISTAGGSSVRLPLDSTSGKWNLAISPDRTQILFDDGYDDVYMQAVAGGPVTNLTAHTSEVLNQPSWSPDGEQIVCRHSSGLKVFALVSNKLVERKFFPGYYYEPAWSPDVTFGSPIAFSSDGGIYTVSLDDSQPKFAIQYARSPAWSPDGRRLAYVRNSNIFVSKVFADIN